MWSTCESFDETVVRYRSPLGRLDEGGATRGEACRQERYEASSTSNLLRACVTLVLESWVLSLHENRNRAKQREEKIVSLFQWWSACWKCRSLNLSA